MRYARAHLYIPLRSQIFVWFQIYFCSLRWSGGQFLVRTCCDLDLHRTLLVCVISAVRLFLFLGQWDESRERLRCGYRDPVCLAADLTIRMLVWVCFLTNASVISVCDHLSVSHTSTETWDAAGVTPSVFTWTTKPHLKAHLHSCV